MPWGIRSKRSSKLISNHSPKWYYVQHNFKRNNNIDQFTPKFREVKEKFARKVCCDVICTMKGTFDMMYDIRETIMYEGHHKRKTFIVSFIRDECEIVLQLLLI